MSKNTLLSELINYVSANASGNVTIAAPSSGYALDVSGTGRFTGTLQIGGTGKTSGWSQLNLADYNTGGSVNGVQIQLGSSATNFGIGFNGSNFTLGLSSNGTTFSSQFLNVTQSGAATFSSTITANGDVTINGNRAIYMTNPGVAAGSILFYNSTTSLIKSGIASYYSIADQGNLEFLAGGSSTKMILTSAGNLGIGSNTPDSKINIISGATRGMRIDTDSGVQGFSMSPNAIFGIDEPGVGNGRFVINTSGNIGMQTGSPANYSGFTTLHINGKSGANGGVLRLTAYDSTSSANIYAGASALNINTTAAVPIKFLTRDTLRMQILDNGAVNIGWDIGNQYSMTSGGGSGTSIVDTGITYNTGDYGGYNRGATYQVVFNGNPNAGGSGAYFAQYTGIITIYTGWSGSAVTTYINYTQLATGNNISTLTLTPVFWNGSSESSSIGVYTTGAQIRLKISGYNSSYTGSDQSVYLKRLS